MTSLHPNAEPTKPREPRVLLTDGIGAGRFVSPRLAAYYVSAHMARFDGDSVVLTESTDMVPPIPPPLAGLLRTREGPAAVSTEGKGGPELLEGWRNSGLSSYAGQLRARGFESQQILKALREANAVRCFPPLQDIELRNIVKPATNWKPYADRHGKPVRRAAEVPRGCLGSAAGCPSHDAEQIRRLLAAPNAVPLRKHGGKLVAIRLQSFADDRGHAGEQYGRSWRFAPSRLSEWTESDGAAGWKRASQSTARPASRHVERA